MSNEYEVLNYIITDFIPNLILPFTFGMILIGLITRFLRNGINI